MPLMTQSKPQQVWCLILYTISVKDFVVSLYLQFILPEKRNRFDCFITFVNNNKYKFPWK